MKLQTILWLLLLLVVPLFSVQAEAQDSEKSAIAKVRSMYFALDFEEGYYEGQKLLEQFPDSQELRAWFILNMTRNNMADDASAQAQQMVDTNPNNPWAWFALAGAFWYPSGWDKRDKALSASEKFLTMMPDHPDALWLKAKSLGRTQRKDETVAYVNDHRAYAKDLAEFLAIKGEAQNGLSLRDGQSEEQKAAKLSEALATFEEARKIDPSNPNIYYLSGQSLTYAGRFAEAYPFLKKAVALAPNSTLVYQQYVTTIRSLKEMKAADKIAEIEATSQMLLQNREQYPVALQTVMSAYQLFKLDERKKEVEEQILKNCPESSGAEWVLVNRYRDFREKLDKEGFKDPQQKQQYRQMLKDFVNRPHHFDNRLLGDAYLGLFMSIGRDTTVNSDELLQTVQGMEKFEQANYHIVFAQGAISLAERTFYYREAERIARAGILKAEQDTVGSKRPPNVTQEEYQKRLNWMPSLMHDALGWVFFNEKHYDEAEKELMHSYNLSPGNQDNLYHIGRLFEARGDEDQAEVFYKMGVGIQSPGENPSLKALQILYERHHGNSAGFDDYLSHLKGDDRDKRQEQVLKSRISKPEGAVLFSLKNLSGTQTTLKSLRGKIVAINFWGIWCGWCVQEMPDFNKLYEKYKNDPNVVILTINNDPNPDEVTLWMKKNGFGFPVLLDDGYVRKVSVQTFPTTWFLDRQGHIAFKKIGWTKELMEEFSWRIEALR